MAATSLAAGAEAFNLYRQARSQRARTLNALLIPLDDDYTIPLRRAPDIRQACEEAFGTAEGASVTSLRALLGVIGAPALGLVWRGLVGQGNDNRAERLEIAAGKIARRALVAESEQG